MLQNQLIHLDEQFWYHRYTLYLRGWWPQVIPELQGSSTHLIQPSRKPRSMLDVRLQIFEHQV